MTNLVLATCDECNVAIAGHFIISNVGDSVQSCKIIRQKMPQLAPEICGGKMIVRGFIQVSNYPQEIE